MKKYFIIGCLIITNTFYSQIEPFTTSPIKSPEATAFVNSDFLPLDEYSGKTNITIPLYSINLDGLEIPISISYDTGGAKVNTTSSNVGLNWSLSAGGLINKEVFGIDDMDSQFVINSEYSSTGVAYVSYGFLRHLLYYSDGYPIANAGIDKQPDQFHVISPGLSTTFLHKSDGSPIEITKKNNVIKSPFTDPNFLFEPFLQTGLGSGFMYSKVNFKTSDGFKFGFKITNSTGFEYSFYDVEKTISFHHDIINGNQTGSLSPDPYDINSTISIDNQCLSYFINPYLGKVNADAFPIIRLSKIRNPISRREVNFIYEENKIVDNNRRTEVQPDFVSGTKTIIYEHDLTVEKLIKAIIFPEGKIDFYYDSNRLDVRGGKILKKIEIRNNEGILIKGISFEQSYYSSQSGCNDSFYCTRLRLDGISFFDKNEKNINGYTFNYNSTLLPNRYAVDQDYLGYYNGPSYIAPANYKPKIYLKENQGKFSFLPFPFSGYSLTLNGNGSKVPNLTYAKAASLEKITLPTGGFNVFNFELNSFELFGSEVLSPGLRIFQQSLFDSNNILQKQLNYSFNKDNGLTSGQIANLPNFVSTSRYSDGANWLFQNYNNKLELNSSSSYVGYSQVKITELNNGYKLNKYTNINDFPNSNATQLFTSTLSSEEYNSYLYKVNNGLLPSLSKDYSAKRGNLLSQEIFNNNSTLITSVINEYKYTIYGEIPISENYTIKNRGSYRLNSEQYASFGTSIDIQSNLLSKNTKNEFSPSGQIIETINYNYYSDKPILNESIITNSLGKNIKKIYYYPFDSEVSSLAYIPNLNNLNILKPIKEANYNDATLISSSLNSYQNLGNNVIVLKDLKLSKGENPLEVKEQYNVFDKKANLIEYQRTDGTIYTVLYGYGYENKIAEILGATYQQILMALNISNLETLQNKTDSELIIIFNNLRGLLPNAQITSYTHKPLVGVTSITDIKGQTNYFEFDSLSRFMIARDNTQNINNEQQYNYAKSPSTVPIFQKTFSVDIEKKPTIDYLPYTSSSVFNQSLNAIAMGGKGDYKYEWTLSPSNTILHTSANYNISIPCGTSALYSLKVTDSYNNSIIKTVAVNAANCNEPYYAGVIEGTSGGNNQYDFWVNTEGGSFKFKYTWWFTSTTTTQGGSTTVTNHCPKFLTNTGSSSITGTLYVLITDLESGYTVQRSRAVTIYPEFQPSSCFVAGTKITMSNGNTTTIENVKVGDSILTYNIERQKIEIANVEKIVTPIHSEFVELSFDNSITNTNTLDHPYYVKNKGWCSYDPELTLSNYGLHVKRYKEGDIVLHYDETKKTTHEIRIKKLKLISKEQKTYNLQKVSKNHDFFANGILVHNKSIQ
ncbi:hypothetical protein EKL97_05640 [Flavobacterium sp. LS1P28]|uniref:hypothetical protein n=1 Tax=Flavobacterium sp. LS1P28 TaxID=2497752 RepID=UPI000F834246|nr:hypothetical protein [Flavobacterium sp. LS1P28]RTY83030.1 hypothetical protein EKL97_05640 [Flavobacterium sp. LS1P28]